MKRAIFFILCGVIVGVAMMLYVTRQQPSQQQKLPPEKTQQLPPPPPPAVEDALLPDAPQIQVLEPKEGALLTSPLHVEGQVVGSWMFEASMPVSVLDGNKKLVAKAPATTEDNWMTTDFVHFSANLAFKKPSTPTGFLLIESDNPSGDPEKAKSYMIPVRFE